MHSLMVCDWTTIRATSSTSPVAMGEENFVDVSDFTDAVFWVDCREVTGTVTLNIQTSVTRDTLYFKSLQAITLAAAPAPVVYPSLLSSATVPLAAWLRWQLSSSSATWDATFRIWMAANSPGR